MAQSYEGFTYRALCLLDLFEHRHQMGIDLFFGGAVGSLA